MLYEVYDIDSPASATWRSKLGCLLKSLPFEHYQQNELAAKYIHQMKELEEHLYPEMGNHLFQN